MEDLDFANRGEKLAYCYSVDFNDNHKLFKVKVFDIGKGDRAEKVIEKALYATATSRDSIIVDTDLEEILEYLINSPVPEDARSLPEVQDLINIVSNMQNANLELALVGIEGEYAIIIGYKNIDLEAIADRVR